MQIYSASSRTHPNRKVGANFLFKWCFKIKVVEVIKPFTDSLKIGFGNLANRITIKPRYAHYPNLCECRITHFALKFKRHIPRTCMFLSGKRYPQKTKLTQLFIHQHWTAKASAFTVYFHANIFANSHPPNFSLQNCWQPSDIMDTFFTFHPLGESFFLHSQVYFFHSYSLFYHISTLSRRVAIPPVLSIITRG